jgi:two-component system NarL family sensor kinase
VDFLKGTVYSKALAIFLAAVLGLLGAVVALSQLIILREFNQSELREMKTMLQRFSFVVSREMKPLEGDLVVLGKTPEALALFRRVRGSEIDREISADSQFDFLCYYDENGDLFRLVFGPKVAVPLRANIEAGLRHLEETKMSPGNRSGFVAVGESLALVALVSVPGKGDVPAGFLLGGRFLQQESLGFLEGLFGAAIRFSSFGKTVVNETSGRKIADLLNNREVVIEAEDPGQIVGYRLVKDIGEKPIGYISIAQARPLRQEGLRAVQVFLTGICLAGGALVLVVWFLLDRTILARIKDLTRKLNAEKQSGRLPVKLNFRGEDELAVLARGIEDLAVLLERTQSLHRAVLEDQTELICRFDPDFRLTFANAIFLRLFQVSEPALSRPLPELLPAPAWKGLREQFEGLSPEKPLVSYTGEFRPAEKQSAFWFRCTLRKIFSPEGRFAGGQWVMADITAQVNAQRKMIESERRFRRLFETASDGLLLVEGRSLVVSDISPSLCVMLMVSGGEILGLRLDELPIFSPCVEFVKTFLREGTGRAPGSRTECRLSRSDETTVFVELRCGSYDVDGTTFVQLSFRNVSERVLGEKELRRLSAKLLRLQDDERRRIARELHDSTAQNLSALEMNMSLLEPLVRDGKAAQIVAETRQIAMECSRELRNVSYLLHPPLIDEVGLAFAVKWFADGFSKRTGISTTVEIDEAFPRLDTELEMPLFRVVQEGMTNIYRHSGADRAWVRLENKGRSFVLEIRDNGRGFGEGFPGEDGGEKERSAGVGLAGIKERLANVGGTLEIESSPLGSTLTIRVPFSVAEDWGGKDGSH